MGPVFLFGTGRCGSTHLQRLISVNTEVWVWGEHDGFLQPLLKALAAYEGSEKLCRYVFEQRLPSDDGQLIDLVRSEGANLSWMNRLLPGDLRAELRELIDRMFSRGLPSGWSGWGFKEIRYGGSSGIASRLLEMFPECTAAFTFREPQATLASMVRCWHQERLSPERLHDIPHTYNDLAVLWLEAMRYFIALKQRRPDDLVMLDVRQLNDRPEAILKLLRLPSRRGVPCVTPAITNRGPARASVEAEAAIAACFAVWRDEMTAVYRTALALRDRVPMAA